MDGDIQVAEASGLKLTAVVLRWVSGPASTELGLSLETLFPHNNFALGLIILFFIFLLLSHIFNGFLASLTVIFCEMHLS